MEKENESLKKKEQIHGNGITKYFVSNDVKQAVKEAYEELNNKLIYWQDFEGKRILDKIFKNKFGFEL